MHNIREKVAWAIAGVLALFVAVSAAGVVQGGPLDPPGPVGSTMRTIDEVLPSWSKALTSNGACTSQRFSCVFSGQAVLDHETGLVWQRNVLDSTFTQGQAREYCLLLGVTGRLGWRLPTLEELMSLVTPDAGLAPFLPAGHPFVGVSATEGYWSGASIDASTGRLAYFDYGLGTAPKSDMFRLWCVRGGQGYDG